MKLKELIEQLQRIKDADDSEVLIWDYENGVYLELGTIYLVVGSTPKCTYPKTTVITLGDAAVGSHDLPN